MILRSFVNPHPDVLERMPNFVTVWESLLKLEKVGEIMRMCAKCYC